MGLYQSIGDYVTKDIAKKAMAAVATGLALIVLTTDVYAQTTNIGFTKKGPVTIQKQKDGNVATVGDKTFICPGNGTICTDGKKTLYAPKTNYNETTQTDPYIQPELNMPSDQPIQNEPDYPTRIKDLNQAIEQNPNNASLYIQMGDEYVRNKSPPEERIKNYQKALIYSKNMTHKDNAQIRYNLGVSLYDAKEFKKSKQMFEESLKYNSSNQDAKDWIKEIKKRF